MKSTPVKSTSKTDKSPAKAKTVKAKSDAAKGLHDLFLDGLKDMYWAEKALTKAIPKMIKNATDESLIEALTDHLEVTNTHVSRLEDVFLMIGEKAEAEKCDAMEGLIKEGDGIMEETEMGPVRDAGIIAAGQKIEHYEIASYGTLAAFAKTLGMDEVVSVLDETLTEEMEADERLSEVAESSVNSEAAEA